jgi:hypothetical protein
VLSAAVALKPTPFMVTLEESGPWFGLREDIETDSEEEVPELPEPLLQLADTNVLAKPTAIPNLLRVIIFSTPGGC